MSIQETLVEFPLKGNCTQYFCPSRFDGLYNTRFYSPEPQYPCTGRKNYIVYASIAETPNWTEVDEDGQPFRDAEHCERFIRWVNDWCYSIKYGNCTKVVTLSKDCRVVKTEYRC